MGGEGGDVAGGAMRRFWRRLRCRLRWCGGYVVSGTHDGVVWVGWRCDTCGIVKYYSPAHGMPR